MAMDGAKTTVALALASALLGAGYATVAGTSDEGETQGAEPTASAQEDGTSRSASTEDEGSDPANETVPAARWHAVSFEGQLGVEATVCGPVGCVGTFTCVAFTFCETPAQDPRVDRYVEIELDQQIEQVNLTLTWDAVSPATEELRLGLSWACGQDGCTYVYVEGPSPLVLEQTGFDGEEEVAAWVWTPDQGPEDDPTVVQATHDQPFSIDGAVATGPGG